MIKRLLTNATCGQNETNNACKWSMETSFKLMSLDNDQVYSNTRVPA